MKKITLLIILLTLSFKSFGQFPETFDTEIPATWATFIGTNGEGTVENWQHNASGYIFCVYEAVTTIAEDWLVSPQVAITASNSILTFDHTDAYATNYGTTYTIRVSTGASQTTHADFTTVQTFTEADIPVELQFGPAQVDLSAYIGQSIYIAFVMAQNDGDYWFLDNIDLVASASAPDPVTTPVPADGASNVYIDPTDNNADTLPDNAVAFDWTPAATGDPATSYDVYLGDSPTTLNLLGNTPNDMVDITGMEYSTLYYWQIVARNVGGEAVGSAIWSFTTESDPLTIEEKELNSFTVYPNPVKDIISIETSLTIDSVKLVNQLGQTVLTVDSDRIVNNEVDLSSLSNGLYFMTINSEGRSESIKIIKE